MELLFDLQNIKEEIKKLPMDKRLEYITATQFAVNKFFEGRAYSELSPADRLLIKTLEAQSLIYESMNFEKSSETATHKIQWNGTETQLVYLFQELVKIKLLPEDFLSTTGEGYRLIASHFLNKKGKPFKNTQLAQTYQNLILNKESKPKNADKIDKVVSKTKRKKE